MPWAWRAARRRPATRPTGSSAAGRGFALETVYARLAVAARERALRGPRVRASVPVQRGQPRGRRHGQDAVHRVARAAGRRAGTPRAHRRPAASAARCPAPPTDEAALLARLAPGGARDRRADARPTARARPPRRGASVIVVDDGFSHHALERDLDLVLLDAASAARQRAPAALRVRCARRRRALARAGAIVPHARRPRRRRAAWRAPARRSRSSPPGCRWPRRRSSPTASASAVKAPRWRRPPGRRRSASAASAGPATWRRARAPSAWKWWRIARLPGSSSLRRGRVGRGAPRGGARGRVARGLGQGRGAPRPAVRATTRVVDVGFTWLGDADRRGTRDRPRGEPEGRHDAPWVGGADADVLVLGSGIGGLFLALSVAERATVTIVTKKQDHESNTNYAQGGIAAVLSGADSFDLHVRDTLVAGAGLCHPDVVRDVVRGGPGAVRELAALGVRFTREGAGLRAGPRGRALGAAHRARRATSPAARSSARSSPRPTAHPNVILLENHLAVDLLLESHLRRRRAAGARGRRRAAPRRGAGAPTCSTARAAASSRSAPAPRCSPPAARARSTSTRRNPDIATGDGVAMA